MDNDWYKQELKEIHKDMIDGHFGIDSESSEFKQVAHYIKSKADSNLYEVEEKAIKPLKKSAAWKYLAGAAEAYRRIKYRITPHFNQVGRDLALARIYVDLAGRSNFSVQAKAVSAGVPQISRLWTYFIEENVTGKYVKEPEEVLPAIEFFVDDLAHWNEALVTNVEMIDDYSEDQILEIWKGIWNGKEN
jgi:hypothetical protein